MPALWNPETGRADGRSENALTVNRAIDDLTKEIKGHYKRIKDSLGFVTAELVKNAVIGIGQKPLTLLELFREHNEEVKTRIGTDCVEETYKIYIRSHNHLQSFIQKKMGKNDITLRSLDKKFYEDFENYLYTDCRMKDKTVYEELYRLKKMSKRAVSQGTLRHLFDLHRPGLRRPQAAFGKGYYPSRRRQLVDSYPAKENRHPLGNPPAGCSLANHRKIQGGTER